MAVFNQTNLELNQKEIITGMPLTDLYTPTVDQKHRLGSRYRNDGVTYTYAKAGAVALVAGELQQSAAFHGFTSATQPRLTVATSSAIGDTWIYATTLTDAVTANQLAEGYIYIAAGTAAQGRGTRYKIVSHAAGVAGSTKFFIDRPLTTAITAGASLATIVAHPYARVIAAPATTPTGIIVGVSISAVTANYYCFLQTWGMANVLVKTATTAGTIVVRDVAAASSAGVQAAGAGSLATEMVGVTGWVIATTEDGPVFLMINP